MTRPTTMSGERPRRVALIVFLLLFGVTQALLWSAALGPPPKVLIGDEAHYLATAQSILTGGAWMPSTIWPPLQPLFIAALFAVFGAHVLVVQIAQWLLFVLCAALLRDLWRRFDGRVAAANLAAALFLLHPGIAGFAQWLWPEMLHLALLLGALCLLLRLRRFAASAVAGSAIGLAMLTKSLLSMFWPALLLLFVRRGDGQRPRFAWQGALAFATALAATTAPALWHGWTHTGTPMIADSSMYNLWVGLTDRSRSDYVGDLGGVQLPEFLASADTPLARNAIYRDKIFALVHEQGLAATLGAQLSRQYFRLFSAKTLLVSQLPGAGCAGRLSAYAASPAVTAMLVVLNDLWHALILTAAAFGIALWRRWRTPLAAVIALFVAYQLGLFLLLHVKARFLLPMLPFLCGFAASAVVSLAQRIAHRRIAITVPLSFTPWRGALGSALALLLLFLAFAGPALDGLCAS